jgi:predicted NAD/FAD-binding protein
LTYYMNRLQNLQTPIDFCVSLNQKQYINPEMILQEFQYAHPVFDNPAVSAQTRFAAINGTNKIFYCGAYWGSGFHEDGVNSALAVADMFGLSL